MTAMSPLAPALSGLATGNTSLLLDAVPDPLVVTDVEGVIAKVSKSAARLLGYPASKLEGRSISDFVAESRRRAYFEHRDAFLATDDETGPELETVFVTSEGTEIPIDASVGRVMLDGEVLLILAMREVSDRLETQHRLEHLVALDELTMGISSRLNTPEFEEIDGAIAASVGELAEFCGADDAYLYRSDDRGGHTLDIHITRSPDHSGLVSLDIDRLPWVRQVIDRGVATKIRTHEAGPQQSMTDRNLLRAAGVVSMVVVPLRASGRPLGFLGIESASTETMVWPRQDLPTLVIVQDYLSAALERQRVGHELRRANRMLHAVSECNDTLIRTRDENELLRDVCRIVVETGDYSMAWVGYALDDAERSIAPQAHWGDTNDFMTGLELSWGDGPGGQGPAGIAVRSRGPVAVQDTAHDTHLDWQARPFDFGFLSVVAVPVFYGDEVAGVMAVYDSRPGAFDRPEVAVLQRFANDLAYGIAALRAREREAEAEAALRELLRSKDELIATIAHELRTPLTGVVGFAQLLRDDEGQLQPETRAEMIRHVADQGMDLTNIVDDLLVAAKAEAGTLEIAEVSVDLRAQSAQVLEAWGKAIIGEVTFSGGASHTTGDPARIRQILRNLVSNALRYGGEGITVSVGSDRRVSWVEVIDDGVGVAEDESEAIFEPYRRAHNAPGLTASMGLGLAISRRLARMMGGDLLYERRDQQSVFRLVMPAA